MTLLTLLLAGFQLAAQPTLLRLIPDNATQCGPGVTRLQISGTGFADPFAVTFGDTPLTAERLTSATQAAAAVPDSATRQAGVVQVRVSAGGRFSNTLPFTVKAGPVADRLVPPTITAGQVNTIDVFGRFLTADTKARLVNPRDANGARALLTTNFIAADSHLQVTIPANLIPLVNNAATTYTILLVNADTANPEGAYVCAVPASNLTVTPPPTQNPPTISGLAPASATAGGPAFDLAVSGTNFVAASRILWAGEALTTTLTNGILGASIAASRLNLCTLTQPQNVPITVTSGTLTSALRNFVINPAPRLNATNAVAPATVNLGQAATVTLFGTNFNANTRVRWTRGTTVQTLTPTVNQAGTQLTVPLTADLLATTADLPLTATLNVLPAGDTVVSSCATATAATLQLRQPTQSISLTVNGVPATTTGSQSVTITSLGLSPAPSTPLTGQLLLTFTPTVAGLPADFVNPAVVFASTNSRTFDFNVAAGATTASVNAVFRTGTIAGNVTLTIASLMNDRRESVLGSQPRTILNIPVAAPEIRAARANSVCLVGVAGGLQVQVDGFATARDLSSASIEFTLTDGTRIEGPAAFQVPLTADAATWFSSAPSRTGGDFGLTVPFVLENGDISAIRSANVTIVEGARTSRVLNCGK